MSNGKRNVRILVISLFIYIMLHAIAYELKDDFIIAKIIHGYFFYILFIDFFASAILYKIYYGRTILEELAPYEKDIYDEQEHKYYQNNPLDIPVLEEPLVNTMIVEEEPLDNTMIVEEVEEVEEEPSMVVEEASGDFIEEYTGEIFEKAEN